MIVDSAGDELYYSGDSDTDNHHHPFRFRVWITITCYFFDFFCMFCLSEDEISISLLL